MKFLLPIMIALLLKIFDKEVMAASRIIRGKLFESTVIVGLLAIITLLIVKG